MGCGASNPGAVGGEAPRGRDPSVLDLSGKEPGEVASMIDSASSEVKELILKGCQLRTLPDSIGRLGKLDRLDVSENQLEALPAAVAAGLNPPDAYATPRARPDEPADLLRETAAPPPPLVVTPPVTPPSPGARTPGAAAARAPSPPPPLAFGVPALAAGSQPSG